MKFLKTFLFSISFSFISFGIVTIKGFCASVVLDPSLSPAVNSNINQFSTFAVTPEYMSIYGPAYIDELNTQLYANYGWDLETLSWYGEDRFKGYMFGQETNPLNSTDLTPVVANAIANRMLSGTIETIVTAKNLYDTGYNYFSTAVPQWGNNAKQWILGQVDSVTGKISQVGQNVVTKITADGMNNLLTINQSLINDGLVENMDDLNSLYSYSSQFYSTGNDIVSCKIDSTFPLYFYCTSSNSAVRIVFPTSYLRQSGNVYFLDNVNTFAVTLGGQTYNSNNILLNYPISRFILNNVEYGESVLTAFYDSSFNSPVFSSYQFGSLNQVKSMIEQNVQSNVALSYDYSSSWQSALQGQLDRLIGKYVDSIALKRIQEILDSIPIGIENVGGVDVPVAIPTQSIVDYLTSAVDDAVALDPDYALVFEDADAVVLDPDVPLPTPNNQGTEVPEDFPDTIFSPITDSVGGMFDIVSIFEPLFYIFSFSAGLLGLWLVVPFVILFLILFRLLK